MNSHAAFVVRLKLRPAGYRRMESLLGCLNWLYNQALESRKTANEQRKESLSFYDQCKWLTQLRTANEHQLGELAIGASRGMLKRLDLAFQAFFRRVRAGEAPGFPRFRPISRCRTIDVADPHNGMVRLHNGHYLIRLKGFPRLRVRSARPLPLNAPLKAVRLTQRGRRWEASLVYAVDKQPLTPAVAAVGIDLGIRKRMTCLTRVERAFRSLKTTQLEVRPLYVYSAEHVRGHVFLCMLAYYLEWHLRRKLAPLLFEDSERAAAAAQRASPVEPAEVSPAAKAKAASKRTPEGLPVQSLRTLLEHLGALALNYVTLAQDDQHEFPLVAQPTALQAKAFALLDVDPDKIVSSKMTS